VRSLVRDAIRANLPGADAAVPNSVLRVVSDVQGATCHLTLQYIDWLALQLLPDTAEEVWLDRHGHIWLTNSDGTTGRKGPTLAHGIVTFIGTPGTIVPNATRLNAGAVEYETTAQITLDDLPTPAPVRAIDPGSIGNQIPGATMGLNDSIPGVENVGEVVVMTGGTDVETDDDLRTRVLLRIRNPPMGGAAHDYVQWTLAVPGVTRAWCAPLEMGMGTVTVRFMMDGLRQTDDPMTDGFPLPEDIEAVRAYLDSVRPVAVKDFFVVAPIPEPINFSIANLVPNDSASKGAIEASVKEMLREKAAPAHAVDGVLQPAVTIWAAWVAEAGMQGAGVESFTLIMNDHPMPHNGALAVIGTVTYV
jgi:uncharacterized phage protein gp47/JayE